jgi:hypothetical protein
MEKRNEETNTGEGDKGKRGLTVSDDEVGKSLSDTSTSTGNVSREFPVSSVHTCVQSVRKNIRGDMEDRWVTNLNEDRKRFYLVSSLLDPLTKILVL